MEGRIVGWEDLVFGLLVLFSLDVTMSGPECQRATWEPAPSSVGLQPDYRMHTQRKDRVVDGWWERKDREFDAFAYSGLIFFSPQHEDCTRYDLLFYGSSVKDPNLLLCVSSVYLRPVWPSPGLRFEEE